MTFWDWLMNQLPAAILGAVVGAVLSGIVSIYLDRKFLLAQRFKRLASRLTGGLMELELQLVHETAGPADVLASGLRAFSSPRPGEGEFRKDVLTADKAVFRVGPHVHQFVRLPDGRTMFQFGPARVKAGELGLLLDRTTERLDALTLSHDLGAFANGVARVQLPFAYAQVRTLPTDGLQRGDYEVALSRTDGSVAATALPDQRIKLEAWSRSDLVHTLKRLV